MCGITNSPYPKPGSDGTVHLKGIQRLVPILIVRAIALFKYSEQAARHELGQLLEIFKPEFTLTQEELVLILHHDFDVPLEEAQRMSYGFPFPHQERQERRDSYNPLNPPRSIWDILSNPSRVHSSIDVSGTNYPLLQQLTHSTWRMPGEKFRATRKLYRVDSLEHILSIIKKNKLWLARPESWDDPWEDPVARLPQDTKLARNIAFHYSYFAQCWSTNPCCEATWRRKHAEGCCIQIETTFMDLCSSLYLPSELNYPNVDELFFLQPVQYLDVKTTGMLKNEVSALISQKADWDLLRISSLFAKRNYYEYEKEVRLVLRLPPEVQQPYADHYELTLDPNRMIHAVKVDPWCGEYEYEMIKEKMDALNISCSKCDLAEPLWNP